MKNAVYILQYATRQTDIEQQKNKTTYIALAIIELQLINTAKGSGQLLKLHLNWGC